ncbi:MAG: VOC family protein [Alphaproteobacteria bacterium]|nr:VOC family protein [Alphaproteobacteria bacterium]
MLDYLTLGTNDVKKAAAFYDAVFGALGHVRTETMDNELAYGSAPKPGEKPQSLIFVTAPYDKARATNGNGTMLALKAASRKAVDAFHAAALKHGGKDEGAPGLRTYSPTWYACYVRDPDGNKLSAVTHAAE